jgi:NAD(P)-dependent dehydrogenase (short-subunit alcohol dehydrogenase family)
MREQKKTIFITGGANGIGAATVRYFFEKGWNVCFVDTDSIKAEELLSSLGKPKEVSYVSADVREYQPLCDAAGHCMETYGGLDAVCANAGVHLHADILSTSTEAWQRIIDINLNGVFHTIKATLPLLIKQGKGSIVLMGSDQSLVAKKESFVYGASKGAIGQMAKSLALDYAQQNIRVNALCPATIDTPLSRRVLQEYAQRHYDGDLEKVMALEASEFPLGRIGEAEEVAKAVYFLSSDASSDITGTLLPIDGGYTAQ